MPILSDVLQEFPHITDQLKGKVIREVYRSGTGIQIVVTASDRSTQAYYIDMVDGNGQAVKCEPRLRERQDATVLWTGAGACRR